MKRIISAFTVILLTALIAFGCGPSREVNRVDTNTTIDLSGRWNDADSRMVAEEMVTDALTRPWLTNYTTLNGKKPTVIVGIIRNKSSEHITTDIFINDIERELVNSGNVQFVAGSDIREEIRAERADQQENASAETFKRFYQEVGADYYMTGTINSIVDQYEGETVVLYDVDLELIDIETNLKTWIGNKKIKKTISRDSSSW